jgi:hypothetical protein
MRGARTFPETKITPDQTYERGRRDAQLGRSGNTPYTDVKNAKAFRAGWEAVKFRKVATDPRAALK